MVKKILFIVWNSIIVIAGLELILHFVVPAPLFYNLRATFHTLEHRLTDNRKLIYEPNPLAGEFNADGYRGALFPHAKPSGITRIVFMGDSVVEGLDCAVGERFTDLLNQRLGARCEIINLGVRGYNLVQEAEYFKEKGRHYQPDYVFFGITYNDLELHSGEIWAIHDEVERIGMSGFYSMYYSVHDTLTSLLLQSNLWRYGLYLKYRWGTHANESRSFYNAVYYKLEKLEVETVVDEIIRTAAHNRIVPIFVFLPVRADRDQMTIIKTVVQKKQVRSIDLDYLLQQSLSSQDYDALFFPQDPCHLSSTGNKVVAGRLAVDIEPLLQ